MPFLLLEFADSLCDIATRFAFLRQVKSFSQRLDNLRDENNLLREENFSLKAENDILRNRLEEQEDDYKQTPRQGEDPS